MGENLRPGCTVVQQELRKSFFQNFRIEKIRWTLEKLLIHHTIALLHHVAPLKQFWQVYQGKKFNLFPDVGNWADNLQNLKSRSKNGCYALLVPKLKNSYIYTKSGCLLLKLKKNYKATIYFLIVINICVHHSDENKQKLTKTVGFHRYTSGGYVCPPPPLDLFNLSLD